MKRVTVIGCGAWAMALASHKTKKGQEVTVWAHAAEEAERLMRERSLPAFPDVRFPEEIRYTADKETAVKGVSLNFRFYAGSTYFSPLTIRKSCL